MMGKGKTSGMISLVGKTTRKMKPLGHHIIGNQRGLQHTGKTMKELVKELQQANKKDE